MTRASPLASVLAVACLVGGVAGGCERAAADAPPTAAAGPPAAGCDLTLDGRHEGGHLVALVNGFPVDRGSGVSRYREYRVDATTALVTGANTLGLRMTPLLGRSGRALTVGRPALSAGVACVGGGGVVLDEADLAAAHERWRAGLLERWAGWLASEDSLLTAEPELAAALADSLERAGLGAGPALDSARAWVRAHPVEASASFEYAAGPDFSAVFREAPVIGGTARDSAALRAYAVRLRDLVADRDPALLDELRPRLRDAYAIAGEVPPPDSAFARAWTDAAAEGSGWFRWPLGALAFGASDVELRSWAGGRVWELYRAAGSPLFEEVTGPGTTRSTEVYVAEVDGALRVVR